MGNVSAAWVEAFGALAVGSMALCYALESRSPHFTLAFAFACLGSAGYATAIASWPFAVIELLWSGLALRRWRRAVRDPHAPRYPEPRGETP